MPARQRDRLNDVLIYQIYPKSFRDGNGDGVGDLRGILEGLPHLSRLGVRWVWLSPIFASPMADNGYDTSDYEAINPLFGSMADFEELLEEGAKRGIRFILDIALNHSSREHRWFQSALSDPASPYRDWYHLRSPERRNNWISVFGGPAWSPAGETGLDYLHLFDKSQPDLNWEHPPVRQAIHAAMRFWLAKGVGGFRLDVVTVISKPPGLPDLPDTHTRAMYRALADGPRLHEFLREMRREVFEHFDCLAIGEAPGVDPARAAKLVDPADPMLDLLYHFDLTEPHRDAAGDWERKRFKEVFRAWDAGIGPRGTNTTVVSNHDLARVVSRYGDEAFRSESAKALLALTILMRGVPFLYQGDELGLVNTPFQTIEEIDDVWAITTHRLALEAGQSPAQALQAAQAITRDHARTPFPWDSSAEAGFTKSKPWLKLNPNFQSLNLAAQEVDANAPLAFAQALIALRTADPLWRDGAYEDRAPDDPDLFVFARRLGDRESLVAINLRGVVTPAPGLPQSAPTLCGYSEPGEVERLRPWEVRIWSPPG